MSNYVKITDLIRDYGHWCREVGYYEAATKTPLPNQEALENLELARFKRDLCLDQINKARGEDLDAGLHQAQQNTKNVLGAVFAGIEMGEKAGKTG